EDPKQLTRGASCSLVVEVKFSSGCDHKTSYRIFPPNAWSLESLRACTSGLGSHACASPPSRRQQAYHSEITDPGVSALLLPVFDLLRCEVRTEYCLVNWPVEVFASPLDQPA